MNNPYPSVDHETVFAQAWANPAYTRFEIPPVDINRVLSERYDFARPLTFTRTMLWDMEARKARHPDTHIPYVVEAGSAAVWADRPGENGVETFVRKSRQRLWLRPERYELIVEQTRLDHARQKVTFIGAAQYPGPDGTPVIAGSGQPIFHVVHAVGGEEDRPLNLWLIVFETQERNNELTQPFVQMAEAGGLPGYVEIYIREHLGVGLSRRDTASAG